MKEGKVWIQENKDFLLVLPVRPLWLSLVCACIHQAEQTLKQIGTGSAETTGAFVPQFPLIVAFLCLPLFVPVVSLISQKVRMNN